MKSASLSLVAVFCLLLSASTQSVQSSSGAPAWMLLASECEPGPHDDCSDSEDEEEDEEDDETEPEIA